MSAPKNAKKKKSKLGAAASKKLASIGTPRMSPDEIAHVMFHAEERGEVERVDLEDGSWAWSLPADANGKRQVLKPTPEMLAALGRFETDHEPHG